MLLSFHHLKEYICRGTSLLYGKMLMAIKRKTLTYPALISKDDKQQYYCVFLRKQNEDSV